MMDVSGTDPRTRTGLFLWPWASYPAVAANAAVGAAHGQPIMMGAGAGTVGAAAGSNMLGVSHLGPGQATMPCMIEDQFETFCQRFSYSGAHAAHMSHILPQQQQSQLNSSEVRHLVREHESETNENNHPNNALQQHNRGHISTQRLLSPQTRNGQLHRHGSATDSGIGENVNESANSASGPNSHAAAIAAFASVAANSGVMCGNESNGGAQNPLSLPHGMQVSRHNQPVIRNSGASEIVLDGLCNGFVKPNQFSTHLQSSMTNVLNRQQPSASPSRQNNTVLNYKAQSDAIAAYNLHCHHIKDLSNTAAVALAAAAAVGEHSQFMAQGTQLNNGENNTPNDKQTTLDEQQQQQISSRGGETFPIPQRQQQQQYLFSPKSPLSDSLENSGTNDSAVMDANPKNNQNSVDCLRTSRLAAGMRETTANLIFRNTNLRKCSPESTTEQRSSDILMEDHLNAREDNNNNNNNNIRVDKFFKITQDENLPINAMCNGGEGSMSSVISVPNGHNSFHHPTKGYKCKICHHVCFSRHDLSAHNASTHKQDPRPYRCEQCGRQFSTCAYLSQHRRIHTGIKPYSCRYCDRHFTQLSHVQQHERIHTGEKPYRCTTCMKSFTQMSNLQSHQRQHMKGKPFRCEQCFMSFDSKEELDVHVQAKHSGNRYAKVLVCPICTKTYNSETYLAKHVERHKEAVATASGENNPVAAAALNGMRTPACVDNIFAAGFHNHSVAMAAAAASALSRGGIMDTGSNNNNNNNGGNNGNNNSQARNQHILHPHHHHHHHHQQQQQAAAVAAAAAAQAHDLHMRAMAAAAAVGGAAGMNNKQREQSMDNQTFTFFNPATCAIGTTATVVDTRLASNANGAGDAIHRNPLNYSSLTESGLFHNLPVSSLHDSNVAQLAAAAANTHRHSTPGHNLSTSGRLTHFDETQNGTSFRPELSPNSNQRQQQQQQQQQYHQQLQNNQRQLQSDSISSKRHSHIRSIHSPGSRRYSESPCSSELNLTQHHSGSKKDSSSPMMPDAFLSPHGQQSHTPHSHTITQPQQSANQVQPPLSTNTSNNNTNDHNNNDEVTEKHFDPNLDQLVHSSNNTDQTQHTFQLNSQPANTNRNLDNKTSDRLTTETRSMILSAPNSPLVNNLGNFRDNHLFHALLKSNQSNTNTESISAGLNVTKGATTRDTIHLLDAKSSLNVIGTTNNIKKSELGIKENIAKINDGNLNHHSDVTDSQQTIDSDRQQPQHILKRHWSDGQLDDPNHTSIIASSLANTADETHIGKCGRHIQKDDDDGESIDDRPGSDNQIPFYLESNWQHNEDENDETNKSEEQAKNESMQTEFSLTRRRRRHQYIPQHLPVPEENPRETARQTKLVQERQAIYSPEYYPQQRKHKYLNSEEYTNSSVSDQNKDHEKRSDSAKF